MDFSKIINEIRFDDKGLVPVIAQDYFSGEVLMLAYMNEEALKATIETGFATYFSRSRNKLWKKGESSGNIQKVREIKLDCDGDTILLLVDQEGPACHTGAHNCFYKDICEEGILEKSQDSKSLFSSRVLKEDYDVIMDRKANPKEGSYTNYLFVKGVDKICKKIGEEAAEIIIGAKNNNKEEVIYEVSDFMYHLMVLMVELGVDWEDIFKEIARRRERD